VAPEVGVSGVVVWAGVGALLLRARLVARLPFAPVCGAINLASELRVQSEALGFTVESECTSVRRDQL
jgi:hypothetical protein